MKKYSKQQGVDFYAAYENEGKYIVGIFNEDSDTPYHMFEPIFKNLEIADIAAQAFQTAYKLGLTEGRDNALRN
ncbi:hypothetical protein [Paenibacillus donghaensis]|uniref:Uncharacterized protein n=1 Tax=Paenibacillus donghaensis TaxID=414771 RepID=A0A2Z2KF61_9BACL|nr:hypothetical protein [Paenibacillus donghaensis]ASA21800.1 hypothetical protein B9T62_14080 [Paenibacillus donghaensis]